MSHYLKFDLLKCSITCKRSSVHQQLHAHDMAEESDIVYLSVPAIKEKKEFINHTYQRCLFCQSLTLTSFSSFKNKQTNSKCHSKSVILAMAVLLIFKCKCWSCWTSRSKVQYSLIHRKISCKIVSMCVERRLMIQPSCGKF